MPRITVFCLFFITFSCQRPNGDLQTFDRAYYQQQMQAKQYSFQLLADCEGLSPESALKQKGARVDSFLPGPQGTSIYISLLGDCCQEFSGDYYQQNDSLVFLYQGLSEEVCECLCLYRYKLQIGDSLAPQTKFSLRPR